MKSMIHFFSKTFLFLLAFFFLSGYSVSQDRNFIGTETLNEGDNTALKTIPQQNNSGEESLYDHLNGKPSLSGDRYVLDGNVIWIASHSASILTTARLDNAGTNPIVSWTLNDERVTLYSTANNTPVWDYNTTGWGNAVDISADGSVIGVARGDQFVLLNKTTGNVDFEITLPDSFYASDVSVARNGDRVVFVANAINPANTARAYGIDLTGSTPVEAWKIDFPYSQIGNWAGVKISPSGNRVVLMGRFHFFVVNPEDGNIIWDHFMDNSESAPGVSTDGNIITTANNSGFVQTWFFDSSTNEYNVLWQYRMPPGSFTNWASSVNISADGSTVVAGSMMFVTGSTYDGWIVAFDTYGNGTPKWTYTGAGDLVDDIAISDDGKVAAAVTWGDYPDHTKPDLLVFDVATGELSYGLVTPGSFHTVDISSDGSRVIAGGKAVHARQMGSGGRAYYVSIDLGGGHVSGNVNLAGTTDNSGVIVKAVGTTRYAVTNSSGNYTISNIPAGSYTITAEKPGYNFGSVSSVSVTTGNTTSNVNFNLAVFTGAAPVLSASDDLINQIVLTWSTLNKSVSYTGDNINSENQLYLADSIAIYRSLLSGGPYTKIASVDAVQNSYSDSSVFPLKKYYYVITRFSDIGQTEYSNEAVGEVNDDLLTFSLNVPHTTNIPMINGQISAGEWDDAIKVDISDVFGYSGGAPQLQGSVFLYMKFSAEDSILYIAGEDFLNDSLDNNEGFGLYFDDNNNNVFEDTLNVYKEGNFWAYWHPTGALVRFRDLSIGSGYPIDTLLDVPVAFSDIAGHFQGELAIPLGFAEGYKLQVFSPDSTVGLGAFLIARDGGGSALFNGWWPQTMNSLFSPVYFGDVAMKMEYPSNVDDNTFTNPDTYTLMQNYPNPFNPSTVIRYQIPEAGFVTLEIYDALGQKISTLVNEVKNSGQYSVHWNGTNSAGHQVSSGLYLYRIKSGNYVDVKKMMLLR